jgi:hypothetical protein
MNQKFGSNRKLFWNGKQIVLFFAILFGFHDLNLPFSQQSHEFVFHDQQSNEITKCREGQSTDSGL